MKKTLAVLIAAVLVVTALCACLTVSAESTNLALNATFIGADPTVGNQYTDRYNAKLNDGKAETEANWSEKPDEWFGFYYKEGLASNAVATEDGFARATFTVDLKEVSSVDSVRIHMVTSGAFDGNGVVAPITLTVEHSADNAAWETLDTLAAKDGDFSGYKDIDWVEIAGDAAVDARYIRISIVFRGYTFMLNEVEVLSTTAGGEDSGESSGEESSAAPVPTVSKNVALGKTYTGAEPSTNPANANYTAKLTDGVAKSTLSDLAAGDWFAYYCNDGAEGINAPDRVGTFVLDLEEVYSVSSVKINTFTGSMWGIVPPESMKVEYSEDGETYSVLEEKAFTAPEGEVEKVENVEFKGTENVNARYIKVTVKLAGVFAFLNEIEVMADVPGDPSDVTDSSTPSGADSTSSAPKPGDMGLIGFAVLAVVALAGTVVAVKARH